MNVQEYLPMLQGNLVLVVRNGQHQIVRRMNLNNTIQHGIEWGVPYQLGIDNSADAAIACIGIDYSMTSGTDQWETGSTPTMSAGGLYTESKVTHTNSYTASTSKTIKRLRMRRRPIAFETTDQTAAQMLSQVTGLAITLQTSWQLQTTWTLRVL